MHVYGLIYKCSVYKLNLIIKMKIMKNLILKK